MASKRKPIRRPTRSVSRSAGRGSGSRVSGAVHVSPHFHLFGNVTLFRFGGGGRGKGRRGGRATGRGGGRSGLFGGLRQTVAELRGKPVSRRVKRTGVRRPTTVQEWEADRREQARLYAELDGEAKVTTPEEDAELAELHAQDVAHGYRLRPSRTRIGHEVDPEWAPEGDDGSRRQAAIRRSGGGDR